MSGTPVKGSASDDGHSEGASSKVSPIRASHQLTSKFMNAKETQAQEILDSIGNDLELQLIVKATIASYKEEKEAAMKQGLTIADICQNTVDSRKRKKEDDEEADDDTTTEIPIIPDLNEDLRRGMLIFANWTRKLVDQCFQYVDPVCMDKTVIKSLTLQSKKEAMDVAFDLCLNGDNLDRVGTKNKGALFESMKKTYIKLGQRLQYLQVDLDKGIILWDQCGPWSISEQKRNHVIVILKKWVIGEPEDLEVSIDENFLLDDEGPFELINQFSVRQAALKSLSSNETYILATAVPKLRKKLLRRPSDETGAANLMKKTALEAQQEMKQSRAKAKAKISLRSLGPDSQDAVIAKSGGAPAGEATHNGKGAAASAATGTGDVMQGCHCGKNKAKSKGGKGAAKDTDEAAPEDVVVEEDEVPSAPED